MVCALIWYPSCILCQDVPSRPKIQFMPLACTMWAIFGIVCDIISPRLSMQQHLVDGGCAAGIRRAAWSIRPWRHPVSWQGARGRRSQAVSGGSNSMCWHWSPRRLPGLGSPTRRRGAGPREHVLARNNQVSSRTACSKADLSSLANPWVAGSSSQLPPAVLIANRFDRCS